jgi:hypothetical protein
MTEYWYNLRTGDVEQGPQSLGSERVGPFADYAEAKRAPEILRQRAATWAAEEAAEDSWGADAE